MPRTKVTTAITLDPEVKREAVAILDEMGISLSTAVNLMLLAVIRDKALPLTMCTKDSTVSYQLIKLPTEEANSDDN